MINDDQIYVVVDIESNGPVAGLFSMLSIGAVATTPTKEVGRFYRKLLPLDDSSENPETMEWWKTEPEAWAEVNRDQEPAETVMKEFDTWVRSFGKRPVFVAHPVGFDYAIVSWYLWKFVNQDPFAGPGGQVTLDLSSYISGKYGLTLGDANRRKLPGWMKAGMPEHTHNALDDAIGYGHILRNVLGRDA